MEDFACNCTLAKFLSGHAWCELDFGKVSTGKFSERMEISVMAFKKDEPKSTSAIGFFERLRHHENILYHFFNFEISFENEPRYFVAMEHFEETQTLNTAIDMTWAELRTILMQLGNGLEYMHCRNIAISDIKPTNVAFFDRDGKKIYKFFNFSCAVDLSDNDFKDDVKMEEVVDLVEMVHSLRDKIAGSERDKKCIFNMKMWANLTKTIINAKEKSVNLIRDHIYMWSPHSTVRYIVNVAKHFEKCKISRLLSWLETCTEMITEDSDNEANWMLMIHEDIEKELVQINGKLFPNIVGLVRIIRHLAVHTRETEMIVLRMGSTDEKLLQYWSECIPNILIVTRICDEILKKKFSAAKELLQSAQNFNKSCKTEDRWTIWRQGDSVFMKKKFDGEPFQFESMSEFAKIRRKQRAYMY